MAVNTETAAFFDKVVVRITSMPFQPIANDEAFFRHLCGHADFMRALFHSHPFIYRRAVDWMNGKLNDHHKLEKLKQTLYNYYTRMYSNTVPYGFFSSVGVVRWHEGESKVDVAAFHPRVKLDMEVLALLVSHVNKFGFIKTHARFFANNTIYAAGNQLRYVETSDQNNKINYRISAVEQSDLLTEMLNMARQGRRINEIATAFASEEYTVEDFTEFLYQLIDEQLLVPEIQLNISGPDPFSRLLDLVKSLNVANDPSYDLLLKRLQEIESLLRQFNQRGNDFITLFNRLSALLQEMDIAFDERHLLQVDNFSQLTNAVLSKKTQTSLYKAIKALSCFNQNNHKPSLENFKARFVEKFEDSWVPLLLAIDTEYGVSFGHFTFFDESALTSDINFAKPENNFISRTGTGDQLRRLLYRKHLEAWTKNEYTVQLTEKDFEGMPDKISQLGASFQVIFNVVNKDEDLLVLRTAGHSSAGNVISRFAYGSEDITEALREIANAEQGIYRDCVIAEIIHVPNPRIGNITFRPVFRQYEIPVITRSAAQQDSIELEDLLVSVRDGRILLWSKKLNKRVIPMLTNAHNYGLNTSPIYQFLSELVYQDILPSLYVDRGELSFLSHFSRRIQFENVILYPATWHFDKSALKELLDNINQLDSTMIEEFRKKWMLPELTVFTDNNSNLLVEWTNVMSVSFFLRAVKDRTEPVYIEEFLFDSNSSVAKDAEGNIYNSEFVALVNNKGKQQTLPVIPADSYISEHVQQCFYPGEEWVYFKLYTGIKAGNKMLQNELGALIEKLYENKLISKFFFIRYNDPSYHLRLRFLTSKEHASTIIEAVRDALQYYTRHNFIWKMQVDTYRREIGRYGSSTMDFSESVFEVDSNYLLSLVPLLEGNYAELVPYFFVKGIDSMLNAFGYDLTRKYKLLEKKKIAYEQEFGAVTNISLKAALDKKEKNFRKAIEKFMRDESSYAGNPVFEQFHKLVKDREQRLELLVQQNRHLLKDDATIERLVNSYLHMYAIRLFQANPRENELVGYYLLYFYYHKCTRTQKMAVV